MMRPPSKAPAKGGAPSSGNVKLKPPTAPDAIKRMSATTGSLPSVNNSKPNNDSALEEEKYKAREIVAEMIAKSVECRNVANWNECFENLFKAFKITEKAINDAQLCMLNDTYINSTYALFCMSK